MSPLGKVSQITKNFGGKGKMTQEVNKTYSEAVIVIIIVSQ